MSIPAAEFQKVSEGENVTPSYDLLGAGSLIGNKIYINFKKLPYKDVFVHLVVSRDEEWNFNEKKRGQIDYIGTSPRANSRGAIKDHIAKLEVYEQVKMYVFWVSEKAAGARTKYKHTYSVQYKGKDYVVDPFIEIDD